jgi:hypothetical protein
MYTVGGVERKAAEEWVMGASKMMRATECMVIE